MNEILVYTDYSLNNSNRINIGGIGFHMIIGESLNSKPSKMKTLNFYLSSDGYLDKEDNLKKKFVPSLYIDGIFNSTDNSMNNGELLAIYEAIKYIKEVLIDTEYHKINSIKIYSDGKSALDTIDNRNFIIKNEYRVNKYEYHKDATLLKNLFSLISELENRNIEIKKQWVRSHAYNVGNIISDSLANIARLKNKINEKKIFRYTDYWEDIKRPFFLEKNYVLYNPFNIENNYILNATSLDCGSVSSDESYFITSISDPSLLSMIEYQRTTTKPGKNLMYIDLLKLYKNKVFLNLYKKYKSDAICLSNKNSNLNCITTQLLIGELPDTSKRISILDLYEKITTILINSKKQHMPDNYFVYDVTSSFYKLINNKFVLNSEIKTESNTMVLSVSDTVFKKDIKIKLILGQDICSRNSLKKYEEKLINVKLVLIKESDISFNHYLVINSMLGDSIYCNPYTNRVIVP